jgi:SPP1 gp7 family putative phage head morphogenesis protein
MRSVQTGRDLGTLAKELQKQYGVTKRRAALISRDQNNKATRALTRARQVEMGIKKALWIHSYAGKKPRPTHLRNDGKPFDVVKGWYDPAEKKFIHPGELVNCRCTSRSIIPGFETPAVSADPALAKILKQYGVTKRKGRIVNL